MRYRYMTHDGHEVGYDDLHERFTLDGDSRALTAAELVGWVIRQGWSTEAAHALPAEVRHATLTHTAAVVASDAEQLGLR
jgi:hypothetical protein